MKSCKKKYEQPMGLFSCLETTSVTGSVLNLLTPSTAKSQKTSKRILEGRAPLPLIPLVFQADSPSALLRRDENGLPFVQRLHLIIDVDAFGSRETRLYVNPVTLEAIRRALCGAKAPHSSQLWRSLNPYRGLLALQEQDADFLFGRDEDVKRFVSTIADYPTHLALALGASGVGKSSLVFAGVFAALERQNMQGGWPANLKDSRLWRRLTLTPGGEPVRSLVNAFVRQWIDPTEPHFRSKTSEWRSLLIDGEGLASILEATDEALRRQQGTPPTRYLLYVDQTEELYTRGGRDPGRDNTSKETPLQKEARRFSELLAEASRHPRVVALATARSDFLDRLQADSAIFRCRRQLDIEPLNESSLLDVVRRPSEILGVTFEKGLDIALVASAREQIVGLPLLSDTLDVLWKEMQRRGDGVLRWMEPIGGNVDVAKKLAERADAFVADHSRQAQEVRRLFCVRLAYVPHQGVPTRRTAFIDELTEIEKALVNDLAQPSQRIVSTGVRDGRAFAEIGHEALFGAWKALREWIAAQRGFYAWATQLAAERREWETNGRKRSAL